MKHSYKISGLSCLGCKSKVESALNEVKGVNEAIVDMATAMVAIDMDSHIELKTTDAELKAEIENIKTMLGINNEIVKN